MDYVTLLILAIGLSLDSFAVSVISGLSLPKIQFLQASRLAIILAIVQAIMPLLGWGLQSGVRQLIAPIDHWISFFILAGIGLKMIYDSFTNRENQSIKNPLNLRVAFFLGLATSMDAMAVGFSVANLFSKLLIAILIIGSTTYFASMTGILIGKKTGPHITHYAELLGGLILLSIGAKILIEHLFLPY
ncbi:manganese efflux pump MntP family protein [uncultured Sunxiuqinia sp.]|uniref:manganese efflux pump MntP n=1 Tax=uncultured Sunxiuqinia sp. TaxID=1573825 RepID=UPI00261C9D18|nr:manganese efflux pump MntP family protein [uncultured Sunxiuqinia sp.]